MYQAKAQIIYDRAGYKINPGRGERAAASGVSGAPAPRTRRRRVALRHFPFGRCPLVGRFHLPLREIWRDRAMSGKRPTATMARAAVEASARRSSEARV